MNFIEDEAVKLVQESQQQNGTKTEAFDFVERIALWRLLRHKSPLAKV